MMGKTFTENVLIQASITKWCLKEVIFRKIGGKRLVLIL